MSSLPVLSIFKREFRSYFLSPVAYIVIAVFLIAIGWLFFSGFFLMGRADMRDFFSLLPILFSFTIPAITMRLYSEEMRSGSYELLLTLPVTELHILLGKFLSALAFVIVMILPTVSYPIFISSVGELDWGPVAGGYIGAVLLSAFFIAIALFASAMTRNQIVSYIIGMFICIFFTLVDKMLLFFPTAFTDFFQFIGADYHFRNISRGILDSRDIVYFLSLGCLALYGTYLVARKKK